MGKYSSVFVPRACSSSIMIRLPEIRVKFAPIILYSYLIHIESEHQFSKGTSTFLVSTIKGMNARMMLFSNLASEGIFIFLHTIKTSEKSLVAISIVRFLDILVSEWKSLTAFLYFISSYISRDKRKLD